MSAPNIASGTEPRRMMKRIAEAVELRGEDEKDEDERQHERGQELVAFDAQLARLAGVINCCSLSAESCAASSSRNFSAWSRGTIATPLIVTALSCCNRLSERGTTVFCESSRSC